MGAPHRKPPRSAVIGVSEYEINCIHDNWRSKTDREIGEILGREPHVIKNYRAVHGLLKKPKRAKGSYKLKKPKDSVEGFCKKRQLLISGSWK